MKKKLLISFSGGETSAYMTWWLWEHKRDEFDMVVVFANTGQENEETLMFVNRFSTHFNIPVVWVEALVRFGEKQVTKNGNTRYVPKFVIDFIGKLFGVFNDVKIGTIHRVVDYHSADRDGKVFESVIAKYGIPNKATPHCTRELKQSPIKSYMRSIGWDDYLTAIGIRADEPKRVNPKHKQLGLIYPLLNSIPMTKPKINFWWSQQPFRLNLKGYQGNCITCWKKSDAKLYQIAKENTKAFLWAQKMELRYDKFIPETRLKLIEERGEHPTLPVRFFRNNRSVEQIINESKGFNKKVLDDSKIMPELELIDESCEVFTECKTEY